MVAVRARATTDPPYSLLKRVKELLDASDEDLAAVIGTSRQHVQSVCKGVYAEHLNAVQIRALLDYARLARDQMVEAYEVFSSTYRRSKARS